MFALPLTPLKRVAQLTAVFLFITPLIFWFAQPTGDAQSQAHGAIQIETITLPAQDLSLLERTAEGLYLSDIIPAPIGFNALLTGWTQAVGSGVHIEIRTGKNGQWQEWVPLHSDHDLALPEEEQQIGQMIFVPAEAVTHDQIQFRAYSHDRQLPSLEFTFIDSTPGPTADELLTRQAQGEFDTLLAPDVISGDYPKPAVIPRTTWCTDPRCFCPPGGCGNSCLDNDPLFYRPVTHFVVHHTVTNNDSPNWAAVVRAIWVAHALNRCWGDIGYNYLIDMNGLIYEGHRGGDNVVGTHAGGANEYSMGVSLIGTFTVSAMRPPEPMRNSLAEILAWKASQSNVDIYSASYHQGLRAGRMHLMGHRDAYGTTECPGQLAHELLPEMKNRVATKLNFTPDHIYIDERSAQFSRGGAGWQVGAPYSCGNDSHSYFVRGKSNGAEATAWGEWRFNAPFAGRYEIEVFTPFCKTSEAETAGARYTVYHAGGQSGVTVNQDSHVGLYTSLGTFDLAPNSDHRLRLSNWTTDNERHVWFDTIRIRYLGPAVVNSSPPQDSWQTGRTITFQWSVSNAPDLGETRLRVATDAQMSDVVHEATFTDGRTSANHTFTQDYADLYWQVGVNTAVDTVTSLPTRFGLDSLPPSTAVDGLRWNDERTGYIVSWSGTDDTSGLQSYRIEYRRIGQTDWSLLLDNVTQLEANVIPNSLLDGYEFRSMGTDYAGNVEPARALPDISTDELGGLTLVSPSEGAWLTTPDVTLQWETARNAPDQQIKIQLALDEQFDNILAEQIVPIGQEALTLNVGGDHAQLHWRIVELARGDYVAGHSFFGIDTTPPTTDISRIYKPFGHAYLLVLTHEDPLSGLASYALQFREAGTTTWQSYAVVIEGNVVSFVPDENTAVYEFRVRGTDRAGNVAPWSDEGIRSTAEAIPLTETSFLPVITR